MIIQQSDADFSNINHHTSLISKIFLRLHCESYCQLKRNMVPIKLKLGTFVSVSDVWREFTNYKFSIKEESTLSTKLINTEDTNVVCIQSAPAWNGGIPLH